MSEGQKNDEKFADESVIVQQEPQTKKEKKKERKMLKKLQKGGKGFFADFKAFINKGNVVQLAVAFIMGGAFTAIVNSLVGDIFMPFFSLIFGKTDFGNLKWVISDNLTINYGNFILAVFNFLLVSLVLFFIIKAFISTDKGMKKLKKKIKKGEIAVEPEVKPAPAPEPELTTTEKLLMEIKDLLAQGKQIEIKEKKKEAKEAKDNKEDKKKEG